ncbi:LysR family transcriptional regulator [Sphingomicrobium sediminis]|uniref:LysR family transcriptional regulator n=1 Tax=Sphingomicrobium sediminis TaxID=2950949 RepID=A0A9X2EHY7_9SPHN|nr:LysR family transcriptional regulator [Sphingomicrobium sediminis]MCM8558358.1 LysR family transcriptional regulator [Sphingomicrobium sediminis]
MSWRDHFDWNHAKAFMATAEHGSLSAAARALGLTQPTLGRQVRALEDELGAVLFERAGRGLILTPTGEELLTYVRAMAEAASDLNRVATGRAEAIEGDVRLSVTEVAGSFWLPPLLTRMRQELPGIRLELIVTNENSDLRRREADIAVRSARPADPALIAKRVSEETASLYASDDYLQRFGGRITRDRLHEVEMIGFADIPAYLEALRSLNVEVSEDQFGITVSDHAVMWELVRTGAGVGIMADRIAAREPGISKAFAGSRAFPFELWLVSHRELLTSRRVRTVYDWIATNLLAMN